MYLVGQISLAALPSYSFDMSFDGIVGLSPIMHGCPISRTRNSKWEIRRCLSLELKMKSAAVPIFCNDLIAN